MRQNNENIILLYSYSVSSELQYSRMLFSFILEVVVNFETTFKLFPLSYI